MMVKKPPHPVEDRVRGNKMLFSIIQFHKANMQCTDL
jgi:hypothetical protein